MWLQCNIVKIVADPLQRTSRLWELCGGLRSPQLSILSNSRPAAILTININPREPVGMGMKGVTNRNIRDLWLGTEVINELGLHFSDDSLPMTNGKLYLLSDESISLHAVEGFRAESALRIWNIWQILRKERFPTRRQKYEISDHLQNWVVLARFSCVSEKKSWPRSLWWHPSRQKHLRWHLIGLRSSRCWKRWSYYLKSPATWARKKTGNCAFKMEFMAWNISQPLRRPPVMSVMFSCFVLLLRLPFIGPPTLRCVDFNMCQILFFYVVFLCVKFPSRIYAISTFEGYNIAFQGWNSINSGYII